MPYMSRRDYEKFTASTRDERMQWFREARLGMFIHYGLYSMLGTGEWAQANENYQVSEYEVLAEKFAPKEGCAREWCSLAKKMGARYAILTTRHHEGFSLWKSEVNPYNSYNICGRDIVREFVDACREFDLKIGLYSSLMDWHHPDAWKTTDQATRMRFTKYIEDLNTELLTNYGKIDILWYDVPCPYESAEAWDSVTRNMKMRELQPHIIINNRSRLNEDVGTPEESIVAQEGDWEACKTLTGLSWGYVDPEASRGFMWTPHQLLRDLRKCAGMGGNLLLNISPAPDGSVDKYSQATMEALGGWLGRNGDAAYGKKARFDFLDYSPHCLAQSTADADLKTVYLWNWIWPQTGHMTVAGFQNAPRRISVLNSGEEVKFRVDGHRIFLEELPKESPDPLGVTVLKLEFDEPARHIFRSYYPQLFYGTDHSEGLHDRSCGYLKD